MAPLTTAEVLRRIRFDPLTKKGSVYDVIQLVTGYDKKNMTNVFNQITTDFPDVLTQIELVKFPGQGQRPTPAANVPTLFQIMAIAPGKRARSFAKKSMDVFTRACAGQETLEHELRTRRQTLQDTPYHGVADGLETTVEDAFAELDKPVDVGPVRGVVYMATSPWMPCVKIGYWTGSLQALESRYRCYYGPDCIVKTWPCEDCLGVEAWLLDDFKAWSMGGELLSKECVPDLVELLDLAESL